jgi:hypothetical protein
MTLKELRETEWAKKFKEEFPSNYDEAIGYALNSNLFVTIEDDLLDFDITDVARKVYSINAYGGDF